VMVVVDSTPYLRLTLHSCGDTNSVHMQQFVRVVCRQQMESGCQSRWFLRALST
jgi:hypothetical protein